MALIIKRLDSGFRIVDEATGDLARGRDGQPVDKGGSKSVVDMKNLRPDLRVVIPPRGPKRAIGAR